MNRRKSLVAPLLATFLVAIAPGLEHVREIPAG